MTKPTYEELVAEVARLRAKLSVGEDKEFTEDVKASMPSKTKLFNGGHIKGDKITIRPIELWELISEGKAGPEANTRLLAKLGRSLQAMGWTRSAQRGNLVFTLPVDEYAR